MKKLLTAKLLLLIYLFVFTSCSKDDAVTPDPLSPESLSATKWDWISWGNNTGDEIIIDPAKPIYIHFIDGSNIKRISTGENGQTNETKLTYQISKDTLIAYETSEINYFIIKEHTATKLTLSRVKHVKLTTNEEFAASGIFKYNKVVN
jgi:hypothetical protein